MVSCKIPLTTRRKIIRLKKSMEKGGGKE